MTVITVNDDLARQITTAAFPVVLVDESGRRIGELAQVDSEAVPAGLTKEEWEELLRRVENPGSYSALTEINQRLGRQGRQ